MKKLDAAASKIVGASKWQANNYLGMFAYTTSIGPFSGAHLLTMDKPCGQTALDGSDKLFASGGGGASPGPIGGGGTGNPYGGCTVVTEGVLSCMYEGGKRVSCSYKDAGEYLDCGIG